MCTCHRKSCGEKNELVKGELSLTENIYGFSLHFDKKTFVKNNEGSQIQYKQDSKK